MFDKVDELMLISVSNMRISFAPSDTWHLARGLLWWGEA